MDSRFYRSTRDSPDTFKINDEIIIFPSKIYSINLFVRIRTMKERNTRILNKILRLEKIIQRHSLRKNLYERRSNEESTLQNQLNDAEVAVTELEEKITNLRYLQESLNENKATNHKNK